MKKLLSRLALLFTLSASASLSAQANAGLTGEVTDSSGAKLPDTVVTLSNPQTGLSFTQTTNGQGSYRFANVPPQPGYVVTFSHDGFATSTVKDIALNVAITRTQNASLVVGAQTSIEVTANTGSVTLNTTDASIGNNFDVKTVNELPVQDRSSIQILFTLQPGVTSNGSVTGARTDQNSVTLDGMDINDIAAGQGNGTFPTTGGAPPDAIQEFRATVAGLPTVVGTGSGGQFQLVTKNGTNRFHGNLNEYHRDVSTVANSWFNLNTTPALPRPKLIRNQFGGAIGGPVLIPKLFNGRDKLYFFADFNNGRTIQQSSATRVVPLDSFRNGILGYINNGAGCGASSRRTNAPACISELTSAQLATQSPTAAGPYDPQGRGFNATLLSYINGRYPHANDLTLGDGVNTGGYRFQQSTAQNLYNYVGRVDYNISPKQRVFLQYHAIRTDGVQTLNQFDTDPLTYPNQNRSYGYVGSHIWNIGANKVNQFYYGETVSVLKFPVNFSPTGISSFTFTGGLAAPNGSLSAQNRRVPVPTFRDDFNWNVGSHTIQFGGTFKPIKTNSRLTNDYEFVTVGTGGLNSSLDTSMRPTNLNSASAAVTRYDTVFGLALGRIASESRNYNYDTAGNALSAGTGAIRRYRYYQTELYVGDTWKATPSLTLTYGLRYQYYSVPFEANGTQSNVSLGFDEYLAARVTQSASGASGNAAVPFLTYNLGGKANNGGDIYKPSYRDFAPRFAFAYNPERARNTVIRGGFDLDYDRTVVNAINFVQDQLSYLFQNSQARSNGQTVARTAFATDPRIGANLSYPAVPAGVALAKPYTPYVTNGVPTGINNGQVNYAVDKNFKTPYSLAFNMGLQHSLRGGFVVTGSYVGRLGRRLIGQADASQLLDYRDPASGQLMSEAFANLSQYIRNNPNSTSTTAGLNATPRQPWFENQVSSAGTFASKTASVSSTLGASTISIGDFADTIQSLQANGRIAKNVGLPAQFAANTYITNKGYSAYHGALLTVSKNFSRGLQFQFNYTYSHSTDNVSTVANYIGLNTGTGQVCDALVRSSCYGNSDFDVKHNIRSNFVYELPIGRGRTFGSQMNRFADLAVGGWSVSGIPTYRSGYAFSTTTGAYLAGYSNNVPGVFNGDRSAVKVRLHKDTNGALQLFDDPVKAAGAFRNPLGFEYGSRNNLRGPSVVTFDAGVGKRFAIITDKLSFQLRGDGFNVLNHPVFSVPSVVNINSGATFGNITTVSADAGARVIQISGRLEF